jgi:hypothetical protein
MREGLASIDGCSEIVCLRQGNIDKPDTTACFIALEIGVVVVQEGQNRGNNDGDAFAVRTSSRL